MNLQHPRLSPLAAPQSPGGAAAPCPARAHLDAADGPFVTTTPAPEYPTAFPGLSGKES